jgi:hypothetical protein
METKICHARYFSVKNQFIPTDSIDNAAGFCQNEPSLAHIHADTEIEAPIRAAPVQIARPASDRSLLTLNL